MERIVLAYSGGLDTSVAVPWLAEHHGAEVVAVTLDLGQGSELADIRERALALGAVRAHVLDVREEFATGVTSCPPCRPARCTSTATRSPPRWRGR